MSKSKDTKKEVAKTNRRKVVKQPPIPVVSADGLTPAEFTDLVKKNMKSRQNTFAQVFSTPKLYTEALPKKGQTIPRLVVPFHPTRHIKLDADDDYFSGEYLKMESFDYIMTQAPTKDNFKLFWKLILYEQPKMLVCVTSEAEMSTTGEDPTKCYQYFPTEADQSMAIEHPKGIITVTLKLKESSSFNSVKWHLDWLDEKPDKGCEPSDADLPSSVSRVRHLTIHQVTQWSGLRPETGNPFEQVENVARFFHEVNRCEIEILKKSMEAIAPPIIIQAMDGMNRGATAWVIMMLLKDVEKRECFDVIDLMKKLQKMRPGVFSTYYSFTFCIAVALQVAILMKWFEKDCQAALNDIVAKFPERKLNENGQIA